MDCSSVAVEVVIITSSRACKFIHMFAEFFFIRLLIINTASSALSAFLESTYELLAMAISCNRGVEIFKLSIH